MRTFLLLTSGLLITAGLLFGCGQSSGNSSGQNMSNRIRENVGNSFEKRSDNNTDNSISNSSRTTNQLKDRSSSSHHNDNFTSFRADRLKLPEEQASSWLASIEEMLSLSNEAETMKAGTLQVVQSVKLEMAVPKFRLVQTENFDLDGDGTVEQIALKDGKITIQADSQIVWQSQDNWWIDFFFLGDANNDGALELNLIVWKEGSFGPNKPFWIEEEDTEVKNHLFIFKLEQGHIKPVWQSSNLDSPNYWGEIIDMDGDGENELLTIEGSYTDSRKSEVTMWKWNGWGFSRIH